MTDAVTEVGREGVQRLFFDRMHEDLERVEEVFKGGGDYCQDLIIEASSLGLRLGWALAHTPGQYDDLEEWLQAAIQWLKLENYEPLRFPWDNFA